MKIDTDERTSNGKFFDTQLQRLMVWGYFPNPVQHYGVQVKSTWSNYGKPHKSVTYGN